MVTARTADRHIRVLSLFCLRSSLNRCGRNLVGYRGCGVVGQNYRQRKSGFSTDGIRPANLAFLSVDCGLIVSFARTRHQHCKNPIHLCGLSFLSHPGNRDETNSDIVSRGDDLVRRSRNDLQRL